MGQVDARAGRVPSYSQLLEREDGPKGSSWGVFGAGDQLGSLNFLTNESRRSAAALIKSGEYFNLDYEINAFNPPIGGTRSLARHSIFENNPNHRDDWVDSFYLQSTTQIDGLRHLRHPEFGFYGGIPDDAIRTDTPELGIQLTANHGIVGRGVLLDVARYKEEQGSPLDCSRDDVISLELLEATAEAEGVTIEAGDILLIRTGWSAYYFNLDVRPPADQLLCSPGIEPTRRMAAWIWDHGVSLIAADNPALEAVPAEGVSDLASGPPEPQPIRGLSHRAMLHRPLITLLGVFIGELFNLDDLADNCRSNGRYTFFFGAKPLCLVGGVGSPANAMAIL